MTEVAYGAARVGRSWYMKDSRTFDLSATAYLRAVVTLAIDRRWVSRSERFFAAGTITNTYDDLGRLTNEKSSTWRGLVVSPENDSSLESERS